MTTSIPPDYAALVSDLQRQYAALPPHEPVRLAKRTSNLFRSRHDAERPGAGRLRASTACCRSTRRPGPPTSLGMTTYEHLVDATLPYGLMPLVVPQLKTITLGGAVDRARHRVVVVPQRPAARVGAARWTSSPATGGSSPRTADGEHADLFRLPQLLRHARLRPAAADRARAGAAVRRAAPRALRATADAARRAIEQICADAGLGRRRPCDFVDGTVFARDEHYLTLGTLVADTAPCASATTPGRRSTTGRSRRAADDFLTVRDYLWRWDTDWFWCSRAFGVQKPWVRRLWPGATCAPTCTGSSSRSSAGTGVKARLDQRAGQAAARGRRPGRRGPDRAGSPSSSTSSTARSASSRSGSARCGSATRTRLAAVPAATRRRSTSTSASGPASTAAGRGRRLPQPA